MATIFTQVNDAITLINTALKTADLQPSSPPSIVDAPTHFELALHGSAPPKGTISGNFATTPLNLNLKYWQISNLRVEADVGFFGRGSEDVTVTWGLVHHFFEDKDNHPHAGDEASGMLYADSLFLTASDVPSLNENKPNPVVQEHPGNPHWDKFTARLKLDVGSGFKYATIRAWHFYLTGIHLTAQRAGANGLPPSDAPKTAEHKNGDQEQKKKAIEKGSDK